MARAAGPVRMVLMGVSGTGKTRIGELLAPRLGVRYLDGDKLHPPGNIEKMARGEPLTDADRLPWLRQVGRELARESRLVVGCSALRRAYRDLIREAAGAPVTFIHLTGERELIAGRMKSRSGHFMPVSLLDTQLAALEPPGPDEDAVTVDVAPPPARVVEAILAALR